MGLMNAVSRGLSAAGYAGGDMYARGALADEQAKAQTARDTRLAELQEQSGIRTENRAVARADKQRTDQTARIDAAAGDIAEKAVEGKRGLINSRIEDKSSWTPEQQAAVDQSLNIDKTKVAADPKTRTQAAIATGDIDPKTAATFGQKDDAALYKMMWEQQKEEGRNQRSDDRLAASAEASDKRLGYLFAALEKRGGGKGGDTNKEALQFLEGSRKEIASDAANLKALYAAKTASASYKDKPALEVEFDAKFKDIDKKRAQIESDYDFLRDKIGLPSRGKEPAANPAPAPAAAKPGAPAATKTRPPLSAFQK